MKISENEAKIRRARIIDTAFRLFCKHGIDKVTLANVAQESHVSESSIYRYFTNKPQLVLATLNILWHSIGEKLEKSVAQCVDYENMTGLEQISAHLEAFRDLYNENADYVIFSYEAKLYLQRNNISLSQLEYDNLMEEIKMPCIGSLLKGQADGSIPIKVDAEDLFYAIWGSIRGYIVKIVIYDALCREGNPWVSRYSILKHGILSALSHGWTQTAAN